MHNMEPTPEPGRRLNVLTKAERRKRIFGRLREGWAYDEIAREERVSAERIRQIVSEVLGKRIIVQDQPVTIVGVLPRGFF